MSHADDTFPDDLPAQHTGFSAFSSSRGRGLFIHASPSPDPSALSGRGRGRRLPRVQMPMDKDSGKRLAGSARMAADGTFYT